MMLEEHGDRLRVGCHIPWLEDKLNRQERV